MNILFLSRYYPGDLPSRCSAISKIGLDWAAHNLCTAIIKGFQDNGSPVTTINTPPMGSFPAFSKSPFVPGCDDGSTTSLPYCNVAYLKRADTQRRVRKAAAQWCRETKGEKVILFYNFYNLEIIPRLKRDYPGTKAVLLVTDLPEYANTGTSLLHRLNEMVSPQARVKDEKRLAAIDGFILLAPAMAERLPIGGRPWIHVEGIYNDETDPEAVAKSNHKVVMYTGNLGERYGIRTLLDAFSRIPSPDYRLWVRGNGGLEPLVRERAAKDSRIVLMGRKTRKELVTLQRQATLLVNPVLSKEQFTAYFFPSKTLEFMASGTPTLMAKLACMPVEYDEHLFYFKGEDSEQIAEQITEICSRPQEELDAFGKTASQFIMTHKTPKPQIARVLRFFHSLHGQCDATTPATEEAPRHHQAATQVCDTPIAVILTCFNRREKTLRSLQTMFEAADTYNALNPEGTITPSVFLTDDGCTDGTAEAVRSAFPHRDITIMQGNGSLYWAGGMRMAWRGALALQRRWDFFLLMNDDTEFLPDAFTSLMSAHRYALKTHGKGGVYSGVCSSSDGSEITYGGKAYSKPLIGRSYTMKPNGTPQPCQMTNANMLLVSREVTEGIGIFDEAYRHSAADWAYGIEASKAGYPVYITANVCGVCDNDHDTEHVEKEKIAAMSIGERKAYFRHPLRATSDIIAFMRRYQKAKLPLLLAARLLNIYAPGIYYSLGRLR